MSLSNIELFLFSATNIVRAKAFDMTPVKWSYWKNRGIDGPEPSMKKFGKQRPD